MFNYDEKGSNVLPFVQVVLKEVFVLFLGNIDKKMRNSSTLMPKKAMRMNFKKEKRSD